MSKKFLSKNKFDAVHAHNIHICFSYYSLKIIKRFKIPCLVTLHDCMSVCYKKFDCFYNFKDLNNPPRKDYKIHPFRCFKCQKKRYFPLRNILIRHFLNKYADKIIAVSNELKKLLKANGIKVYEAIHNGVDTSGFKIREEKIQDFKNKFSLGNKKIVLFGGRMTAVKGGHQLSKAMELVCKKEPRAWLLILAKKDDPYSKFLFNQAEKRGVNILITGWLEQEDLIAAYHLCDLVVTPSIYLDAFGLMTIEAMACKKPIITSCFSGGQEIVADGKSGYVINPFGVREFADKILDILNNNHLARAMGGVGYEIIKEKFTLEKTTKRYMDVIKQVSK